MRWQDFPYHLDPDVEHHNVWSTRPLPEAELHKARVKAMSALIACLRNVFHGGC